jgi:hypothetical protein
MALAVAGELQIGRAAAPACRWARVRAAWPSMPGQRHLDRSPLREALTQGRDAGVLAPGDPTAGQPVSARLMTPIGKAVCRVAIPADRLRLAPVDRHTGLPAQGRTAKDQLT